MKILIDATPVVHGERAVRRNSRNLIIHLLQQSGDIEYILFYIDWLNNSNLHIPLPKGSSHSDYTLRLPGRFMCWSWQRFSLPTIEHLVGNLDLVYGTDLFFPPARRAVTLGTLRGIAQVMVPDLLSIAHTRTLSQALAYTVRHSDYLLAVSEQTKREATSVLKIDQGRIRVCPHGVDPQMRKLEDLSILKATLEKRFSLYGQYILYVGAISHVKNLPRIIEAYAAMSGRFPDLPLVLAGPWENAYAETITLVNKKGLASRVRFLGAISPDTDDLVYLYNGAKLLLYPTLYEGWTAPPLEAMACGVPVIASDRSSVPETCAGAARLVDPLSVESIVQGAVEVLQDEALYASLVERGFRRAKECSWSHAAKRMEAIFEEIVALGRARKG